MQIGNTGNAASVYGYIRPHQLSSMIHRRAVQPKVHDHRPLSVFIRCVYPIIYDTQRQVVCQAMVRGFSQTLRPAPPRGIILAGGTAMYRILIVEDDPVITETLCAYMGRWGMEARGVEDFQNVLREFAAFDPQLVLMDISLPFFDGYHWCTEIRKISTAPILFISSAGDNLNILRALDAGADDFVSKPFDLSVLMAKVQALLRRAYDFAGQSAYLTCGDLMLNTSDGAVTCRGQRAELTRNENRILTVLMENKGKIVSRDALMARLWETDSFVDENTLSVNITRLRRKLAAVGAEDLIKTRKGMGYLIE